MTSNSRHEKITSVYCQPYESMKWTASGENRNWPKDPAAVTAPKATARQLSGNSLPRAPITAGTAQPDRPKPISKPAER